MTSIKGKRHRISDNITYFFIYLCAAISVLLLLGIIVYVFVRGIGQINWEFLTCETSVLKGTLGYYHSYNYDNSYSGRGWSSSILK